LAKKRMFNMNIVDSDAFLDMPLSTQCLYFHLNMRADDDGFVGNPKRIVRLIGCSDDDLKLLIAKRFVLCFEDGVIVIKHWRMHNCIQSDRYTPTVYQEEKDMLITKPNKSYTFAENNINQECIQNVSTDIDKGKDIDIDLEKNNKYIGETDSKISDARRCLDAWNTLSQHGIKPVSRMSSNSTRFKCLVARISEYGVDNVLKAIEKVAQSDFLQGKTNTNAGWFNFDWFVKPNNFPKVLDGNYDNKPNTSGASMKIPNDNTQSGQFGHIVEDLIGGGLIE
jgi:hypothetical protein